MARLTRTQKFAALREELANSSEQTTVNNDLNKYQDKLNSLQSASENVEKKEEYDIKVEPLPTFNEVKEEVKEDKEEEKKVENNFFADFNLDSINEAIDKIVKQNVEIIDNSDNNDNKVEEKEPVVEEVYDIEMQVEKESELPKRSRYYHTSMDTHFLKKGRPYKDLKPSYVIFICMKDPFEMGEAIYQFQMIDKNLQLQLDDETYTIILAIDCPKGKIPRELETFFTYVEREEVDENDDFVKRIHEKVEEVNRDTEVTEIMTIEEEMNIRWHYGYDEGEAAGLEKGRSEGEAIGAAQEKREIAKSMKAKSIPNADIAEITGLSAEEIEKL